MLHCNETPYIIMLNNFPNIGQAVNGHSYGVPAEITQRKDSPFMGCPSFAVVVVASSEIDTGQSTQQAYCINDTN